VAPAVRNSADLVNLWRDDVTAWAADVLHEPPREWQPGVLELVRANTWMAIAACRKAGKTRLAAIIALWWLTTRADSMVVTIAPVWSQVVQALWAEIRHVWIHSTLPILFPSWSVLTHEIQTPYPKWRAMGFTSADPANLEGRHGGAGGALVILDESKGIGEDFFNSVQGMLDDTSSESMLLAIGTPGPPIGFFFRAFGVDRPLWSHQIRVRSCDIPRLAARYEKQLARLGADNPWFRQQEMAEFSGAGERTIIPLEAIERAINRQFQPDPTWTRHAGLDPAGRGDDESVLSLRWGPVLVEQLGWQGWPEMRSASYAVQRARAFGAADLTVDAPGLGGPIADRCDELSAGQIRVRRWNPGAAPRDKERFANAKVENAFALRERFMDDEISIPNDALLISQLAAWQWDTNSRGKTVLIDPEDSPDYADSALVAFAGETFSGGVRGVTPGWL
jgi:hypothetical protein